jgi:hypothetical protein
MARVKPRVEERQLDADLARAYARPSTSATGRDLLVAIQESRERNRRTFGRPGRALLDPDPEGDDDV